MDVLRNVGRGQLSVVRRRRAGQPRDGPGGLGQRRPTGVRPPGPVRHFDKVYGAEGARVQEDMANYVAGINAYINEARINPL